MVVEKDNNLAIQLKDKFKKQINIINKDILEVDENSLSHRVNSSVTYRKFIIATDICS